jgi:hypothetical protein
VLRRKKEAEERARQDSENARWEKALPKMILAVVEALLKAKQVAFGAGGTLGKLVLEAFNDQVWLDPKLAKMVPPGRTADDLVRHMTFRLFATALADPWDRKDTIAECKALGVDVVKILDWVAPPAPPPLKATAAKKGTSKSKRR